MNHTGSSTPTVGAPAIGTPVRLAAAAAVLIGGLVHLQLYFDGYRDFSNENLGRSFLANGIASALIAAALVVRRDALLRLAGIGLSVGTLIAFTMSRTDGGIFGFTESGLQPSPQAAITLCTEILAIALLGATFVPRIGAGTELQPKLASAIAVVILVFAGVMSVLWAQTPEVKAAAPGSVTIQDFSFGPAELTVQQGATVTWTNADSFTHTASQQGDGGFDSGELPQGQSFSFTFDTAGTFTYICKIHPSMAGTIVVTP